MAACSILGAVAESRPLAAAGGGSKDVGASASKLSALVPPARRGHALQLRRTLAAVSCGPRPVWWRCGLGSRNCAPQLPRPGGGCRPPSSETCVTARSFSEPIRETAPSCVEAHRHLIKPRREKLRRQHQRPPPPPPHSDHITVFRCAAARSNGTSFVHARPPRHPGRWPATTRPCCFAPALPLARTVCCGPQTTAEGGCAAAEPAGRGAAASTTCLPPCPRPAASREALMATVDGSIAAYGRGTVQWASLCLQAALGDEARSAFSRAATIPAEKQV